MIKRFLRWFWGPKTHTMTAWQLYQEPATGFAALNSYVVMFQRRQCTACGFTQQRPVTDDPSLVGCD